MESLKKRLASLGGFSLVELVLYISLSSIVVGITSYVMVAQLDTYAFVSERQGSLADASYTMGRISNELTYVETSDLVNVDNDAITFVDTTGNNVSLALDNTGPTPTITRNGETLLDDVVAFTLDYYDINNNATTTIADIRRITVTLTCGDVNNQGNITLTKSITPRNFIYANYE